MGVSNLPNQNFPGSSNSFGTSSNAMDHTSGGNFNAPVVPPELAHFFAGVDTNNMNDVNNQVDMADNDLLANMAAMPITGVGDAAWAQNDWFEALWRT